MELQVTTKQAAEIFGLTTVAIQQWGVTPVRREKRENYYNLSDLIRHRMGGEEQIDAKREDARLARYRAELARLELAQREGDLVKYSEAVAAFGQFSQVVKTLLLSLPTALAPILEGLKTREIFNILTKEFETLLTEAADSVEGKKFDNGKKKK